MAFSFKLSGSVGASVWSNKFGAYVGESYGSAVRGYLDGRAIVCRNGMNLKSKTDSIFQWELTIGVSCAREGAEDRADFLVFLFIGPTFAWD